MRLGVISDVHANLPALEAALGFLEEARVDRVVCLGDLVGYGPHPNEVVARLREAGVACTLGGAEIRVLFPTPTGLKSPENEAAMAWTRDQLSPEARSFLGALPPAIKFMTPYGKARGFHGRPDDPEAKFPLYDPEPELDRHLARTLATVVLTGGHHVPFFRQVGRRFVLDPGSVGLTLGGEPGADVAILTIKPDGVHPRIYKVPYDFAQTAFDIEAWGLPRGIAEVVRTGKPLG